MNWWSWLIFGVGLLGAETVSAGFYLLFFGPAAILVGAAIGLGLKLPDWLQWVVFFLLGALFLILFRRPLLTRMHRFEPHGAGTDDLAGEAAPHLDDLPPGGTGKAD